MAVVVDERFVGRRGESVYAVVADQEAVLIDEVTGQVDLLNATGALVWSCCDGVSQLRDICRDLADEMGASYDDVAADVVVLAQRLVDRGMLIDVQANLGVASLDDGSASGAMPNDASDPVASELPFAATSVLVRAGDKSVVVASNDDAVLSLLTEALGGTSIEPTAAGPQLMALVGPARGDVATLHFLYDRGRQVLRTPNMGRLLRATLSFLDDVLAPDKTLRPLSGRALIGRRRGAVVVTAAHECLVDLPDRRLARRGYQWLDVVAPLVDETTLELVVPPPRLELNEAVLASINDRFPAGPEELMVRSGRYRIAGLLGLGFIPHASASPARQVCDLLPFVTLQGHCEGRDLEMIWRLAAKVRVGWSSAVGDHDVIEALRAMSQGPRLNQNLTPVR